MKDKVRKQPRNIRRILSVILASVSLLLPLGLTGCGPIGSDHFKVTITLDVDGVEYSGYSIQQFNCHRGWKIFAGMDVSRCTAKGEGVVIKIGPGQYVISIFRNVRGGATPMVSDIFVARGQERLSNAPLFSSPWRLPATAFPSLVSFTDPGEPKSVFSVDGAKTTIFGKKFSVKSVEIRQTGEALTKGKLLAALPWLSQDENESLIGSRWVDGNTLPERLHGFDFKYGI